MARWFTCTPVAFEGNSRFFTRDSGLLSQGFREIGVASYAVMSGERRTDDQASLIRTSFANLESADWWRNHDLDGVVLYAWGRPRYRKVAKAIHEAGIFLVLNQDSGGVISPLNGILSWLKAQKIEKGGGIPYFLSVAKGLSVGLLYTEPLRAVHLKQGDVIAAVSPIAADHYRKLCRLYGGKELAQKVQVLPHPILPEYSYSRNKKKCRVVVVGRWEDSIQKRPVLLTQVVTKLLEENSEVSIDIIGTVTPLLYQWHESCRDRERVALHGVIGPEELRKLYDEAQIIYCPSAYESFHIASGEALCSGCSVVAYASISMSSFPWFCSKDSGTLAESDSVSGHVQVLQDELDNWAEGRRNAVEIASKWQKELHAPNLARRLLAMKAASPKVGSCALT